MLLPVSSSLYGWFSPVSFSARFDHRPVLALRHLGFQRTQTPNSKGRRWLTRIVQLSGKIVASSPPSKLGAIQSRLGSLVSPGFFTEKIPSVNWPWSATLSYV